MKAAILIIFAFLSANSAFGQKPSSARPNPSRAAKLSAQNPAIRFPNELKGFSFYDRGKLAGIRLALTTREQVIEKLGNACEDFCDFDADWEFSIRYFGDEYVMSQSNSAKAEKRLPDEFVGRVDFVTVRPKKPIGFENIRFSQKFSETVVLESAFATGIDGIRRSSSSTFIVYRDSFGLEYRLTLPSKTDPTVKSRELVSISYSIPDKIRRGLFVPAD